MNRRQKRIISQMIGTLLSAAFILIVMVPWMTSRMAEVAQRPVIRMQQQLAAQQAEAERKARAERETMSNVRQLVREGRAEDALKQPSKIVPKVISVEPEEVQFDKEGAWRRWYKKSPECAGGNAVECGNDFIRKRREFEALVSAGKIR